MFLFICHSDLCVTCLAIISFYVFQRTARKIYFTYGTVYVSDTITVFVESMCRNGYFQPSVIKFMSKVWRLLNISATVLLRNAFRTFLLSGMESLIDSANNF